MTDTRKEFEEWLRICPLNLTPSEQQAAQLAWQACQQHYAGRIAELEAKLHKERHDAKTCPVCGVETATVEWIRERKELETKLANMVALVAKKDEA